MMNDIKKNHCYGNKLSQPKVNNYKLCIQSVLGLAPLQFKWVGLKVLKEGSATNARNQGGFLVYLDHKHLATFSF